MTRLHKFNLKKNCFTPAVIAFCILITWNSEARRVNGKEFYSTLTSDTIPAGKKKPVIQNRPDSVNIIKDTSLRDTTIKDTIIHDSTGRRQFVDTVSIKLSKDSLDAPIVYEAADSGVLMVKEKKFYLYGKTQTTYKDVVLTAPKVELDQETNVMKAINDRDSAGNVITRAQFKQGTEGFQSDTIEYNFKTQKGLTRNTFTKQQEMFV
ncbi:MAG TPA: hypothetical protein VNS32_27400, partial [Flavisolibacter sp.]|nr:hypothetical protein [Flavisolibacter sp.]